MTAPPDACQQLLPEWRAWLLKNLVDEVPPDSLIKALKKRGVSEEVSEGWLASIMASTEFYTLRKLTRQMRQTRLHLRLRRRLNGLKNRPERVRERTDHQPRTLSTITSKTVPWF